MSHRIVIGIGSNTPDKSVRMSKAIEWLHTWLENMIVSSIYPTLPEGDGVWNEYSNAVAIGHTDLRADEVTARIKEYESANGRTAELKARDIVTIDLDLVIYDDHILRQRDMSSNYFMTGYKEITMQFK